jgi:hypothetical protein
MKNAAKEKTTVKKAILLAMCLVLFGAGAAMAYTVDNTTQIQQWNTTNAGGWTAPGVSIPWPSEYTTFGADFDANTGAFTIYTNWNPQTNEGVFYNSYVSTAFLFIDKDPVASNGWDYAIDLNNQLVYKSLTGITYSQDAGGGGSYTTFGTNSSIWYGRYYGPYPPGTTDLIPVLATGSTEGLTVAWDTSGSIHTVTLNLSGLLSTDPWAFLWGTATCGNGTFAGSTDGMVPLPPSALLLGTGLLGLVGLGWRRRKTKV